MSMRREFFGWDQPALLSAAGFLVERYQKAAGVDMQGVVITVPGSRAGRRLLELLVATASERDLALVPPRIITAGALPELLYPVRRPPADTLVQRLAWIEALRTFDAEQLAPLIRHLPERDDMIAWMALAQTLVQLHCHLAAEALDFAAVGRRAAQLAAFGESDRWQVLARLQQTYLGILDRLQLWDLQTARRVAIERGECRTDCDIIMIGTVDLDRTQRAMLDQVVDRVTALVFADPAWQEGFDEHGCLRVDAWRTAACPLRRDQIDVVAAPGDQADAALRALAGWSGRFTAEEIVVGVPDREVVPYLEQRFAEAGLPVRYGAGAPLDRSSPCLLLKDIADYLEEPRFAGMAALARHPAVERWLAARGIDDDVPTLLDRYHATCLPATAPASWPNSALGQRLATVHRALRQLLQPLGGAARPWDEWSEPMRAVLVDLFGVRELNRHEESDRVLLHFVDALRQAIDQFAQIDRRLAPTVSGAVALRLVLGQLEALAVPPAAADPCIELLGWLELPWDDAPALVVTGFNEGFVSGTRTADPFLPDSLRSWLQVEDDDRRYARDNYALHLLAASHKSLRVIVGQRSAAGDPLKPSRLLFGCPRDELVARARMLFAQPAVSGRTTLTGSPRPGLRTQLAIARPEPLAAPIRSMRVTEFRDYLACPYRYWLRHCLGLESLSDTSEELDPASFGELLHEVLLRFADGPQRDSSSVDSLRRALDELLDAVVEERFQQIALPAVRIQAEQVRLRLRAFARWQAQWRDRGWQIIHAERRIAEEAASLTVDGEPMFLRGRVDRVDRLEGDDRFAVFDYKTGDQPTDPDKAHRQHNRWIDLQLPLYRHLVRALGIDGQVQLGYIVLPKDTGRTGSLLASWTNAELSEADDSAAEVIRGVRQQRFWPPAAEPPRYCEDLAAICQDEQFAYGDGVEPDDAQSATEN